EGVERVMVVVQGQADLLEVVKAFDAGGGFPYLLHGREEEPDQDGDDGNHHQQFDQRKTSAAGAQQERRSGPHGMTPEAKNEEKGLFGFVTTPEWVVKKKGKKSESLKAVQVGKTPRPPVGKSLALSRVMEINEGTDRSPYPATRHRRVFI